VFGISGGGWAEVANETPEATLRKHTKQNNPTICNHRASELSWQVGDRIKMLQPGKTASKFTRKSVLRTNLRVNGLVIISAEENPTSRRGKTKTKTVSQLKTYILLAYR